MPGNGQKFVTKPADYQQINASKQENTSEYFQEQQRFMEQNMRLQQNTRKILGIRREDSREMAQVKERLDELQSFLSKPISAEGDSFEEERQRGFQLYESLIEDCNRYIRIKGRPFTSSGKARLEMVKVIYNQAVLEKNLFNECARSLFAEKGNQSILWVNVLGEIRTAQINIDNLEDKKVETSEKKLYKLEQKGKNFFFRGQEDAVEDYGVGIPIGGQLYTRNVAASRFASLLGVSNLYAKSRVVEIEQGNKQKVKGALTMGASGESFADLERKAERENLKLEYAPEMIRQLTTLQYMDMLLGYRFRSKENFFAESYIDIEEEKLIVTGLTAINNEVSFGDLRYEDILDKVEEFKDAGFIDLPAIDKEFFEHLQNVSEAHIGFALKDLLSDRELSALYDRLDALRQIRSSNEKVVDKEKWGKITDKYKNLNNTYIESKYIA